MLISHLSDENNDDGISSEDEHNNSLIPRDLVTLYENVEKRQSTVAIKNTFRTSNQYVETIIYKDEESDDSDVSNVYSNEDLCDVILINKERIDLINSVPSLDKTVCHNFDGIAVQPDLNSNCKESILLKHPFLEEQFSSLNNFTNFSAFDGTFLSRTLLNFIFCNHLEGCSNLYMDNIIQYTKHTIDQLKRISNGDYLTEKAKEKWGTMGNNYDFGKDNKLAVVVRAGNNPINEEYDMSSLKDTWRNIMHSALDIRYLRKILEKTIVVRVPRQICNSVNIAGKGYNNNSVTTKQKKTRDDIDDTQIDVVLKIKPTCTKNVEYNINPLLLLQSLCCSRNESLLPIEYSRYTSTTNVGINVHSKITITELKEYDTDQLVPNSGTDTEISSKFTFQSDSTDTTNTISSGLCLSDISSQFTFNTHDIMSNYPSEKQINNREQVNIETQISCFTSPPDDLFYSLQKLNTQMVLVEENEELPLNKKKSFSKVRIKSPYENKSHAIEEMKRRKLLEIRERRERRKKIHSENCKVTKYKHGKGAIMAQSTNSVTKLSISNKSFYTSIYGDNANVLNNYHRKHTYNNASEVILVTRENNQEKDETALKVENKKHLNSNYYLDDPETEVMNLQIKNDNLPNETDYSITPPNSAIIRDLTMNFDSLVKYASYNSSDTDLKPKNASCDSDKHELTSMEKLHNTSSESTTNTNTISSSKKSLIKVECKKSIDKIYELMSRLSKVETSDPLYTRRNVSLNHTSQHHTSSKNFLLPTTESSTSLKPQLNSSNPSIYSFEETNNNEINISKNKLNKRAGVEANVVSKVIISSKSQTKSDNNEIRSNKKAVVNSPENITKNPLKAISHLINEFDHVQKIRQRAEIKDYKRINNKVMDGKNSPNNSFLKKVLRFDEQIKDTNANKSKTNSPNSRKIQPKSPATRGKTTNQQFSYVNKNNDKEKNIRDLVDDALREARGEAVRGPQRPFSRLESLAQPKKINTNGQAERFRQGRTFSSPQVLEKFLNSVPTNSKVRQKKIEQEQINTQLSKVQYNASSPVATDKPSRLKRTNNTSSMDTVTVPANLSSYRLRTISEVSHNLKKATPFATDLKKRALLLSPSTATSNLHEKNPRSFPVPTSKTPHFSRVSAMATSSSTPNNEPHESKIRSVINPLQNESIRILSIIKESKTSITHNESKNESIPPDDLKDDELVSICSDYVFDILEDKDVLTAVSNILPKNAKGKEDMEDENIKSTADDSSIDVPQQNEVIEGIESLEKALYNQIAHGTFHKRLKIKNFTLTPKQSINPLYLLQSGDANSLLVNACRPQTLHINGSKCITEQLHVPIFKGSFTEQTFPGHPVNITTVGYVFSKLQPIEYNSGNGIKSLGVQTPVFLNEIQASEKFSNDEKGVQTILIDDTINCNNFSKIHEENVIKNTDLKETFVNFNKTEHNEKAVIKCENINNTTSLDILVELLDEIEKITKHQSSNTMDKLNISRPSFDSVIKQDKIKNVKEIGCKTILDEQGNIKAFNVNQSNLVDKEVTVNIVKESVNGFTDATSQLCLLENTTYSLKKFIDQVVDETVNKCTDEVSQYYVPSNLETAPNSLGGIFGRNSSHSLISLYDYRAYYSNQLKRAPNNVTPYNRNNDSFAKHENFSKKRAFKRDRHRDIEVVNTTKINRKNKNVITCYVEQKDSDALIKMKRDILVTVYSILVFTVFAALSFPEFLYR